jgi:ATP-dependent Clp protease adapter protein ClpS
MFLLCSFHALVASEDFMADVGADATPVGLVFHNDDKTPAEFVAQLLREVFGRPAREASAVTSAISKDGKAVCGPYPASIAGALVSEVQRRIAVTGHPLRITTERIAQTEPEDEPFKYAWEALEWHFAGMHPRRHRDERSAISRTYARRHPARR